MLRNNSLLAIVIVVVTLLVFAVNQRKESVLQHGTSTVYSDSAFGFHIFEHWANQVSPGIVQIERKVFDPDTLEADQVLFIISPTRVINRRESDAVVDFVKRGGILFLAFEDHEQLYPFSSLFSALGVGSEFETVPADFKNGVALQLSPGQDSRFFRKNEAYSIYASQRFKNANCAQDRFSCYVIDRPFEKGHIVAVSGLPPIANAMIARADNREVAFRLASQQRGLRFDEFHHFYSDYSFWTLLGLPGFGLPFFAMVLCVLLFFLFGRGSGAQNLATAKRRRDVPSYHDLNLSILQGTWTEGVMERSAVEQHRNFLASLFPTEKETIRAPDGVSIGAWRDAAARLVALHRELLMRKRRLVKNE